MCPCHRVKSFPRRHSSACRIAAEFGHPISCSRWHIFGCGEIDRLGVPLPRTFGWVERGNVQRAISSRLRAFSTTTSVVPDSTIVCGMKHLIQSLRVLAKSPLSQGNNFTAAVTAIGPFAMTIDGAGRVDMPSQDVTAWHRQLAANIIVNDVSETDAIRVPDERCPEYAPGNYIVEYVMGRDGREINRVGVCLNFGERGGPIMVRYRPGMRVFPFKASPKWVVAGVVTNSPNEESVGHNLCNDQVFWATNLVSQNHWIRENIPLIDPVNVQPSPFVCPSVSPSATASVTPTNTPTASASISPSPSATPAPPPLPTTNFTFVFAILGIAIVILLCIIRVAVKKDRVVKSVRAKAKTIGRQFQKQVKQLPPREIPPTDEEEKARIKLAKDDKYEADMDRHDARIRAEMNLSDAAKRRLQKQRARDSAIKARQKAKRQKKNLAATRYDGQRTVQSGSLQPGNRIAFDPSHKGVDSLNINKQQDLLKRTHLGVTRQSFRAAGRPDRPTDDGQASHTPRDAWQEEDPLPHGEHMHPEGELTHVLEVAPAEANTAYGATADNLRDGTYPRND